jgi:hypothetical protein
MKTLSIAAIIGFTLVFVLPFAAVATEETTVVGIVNDLGQIIADDGTTYEVADNEKGSDLVIVYAGEKVRVTGTVAQDGDSMVITVSDFETTE